MTLKGFGWLWKALADSGRLWLTLEGFGRLLKALADSERLWMTLEGFGWLWKALADSGRLWKTLEGFVYLWNLAFNDFKFLYDGDTRSSHKGEGRWWGRRMPHPGDNLVITRNGIKECEVPRGARLIQQSSGGIGRRQASTYVCFSKCFSSSELWMMPMVLVGSLGFHLSIIWFVHLLKWDEMREWDQIKEKYAI